MGCTMNLHNKVSTGLEGLDQVIDNLRLGDNVVWQADSVSDYKNMVNHYAKKAKAEQMRLVYIRFGSHEQLLDESQEVKVYHIDAGKGFESFATEIYNLIKEEGKRVLYVFDCLTDLLEYWHSDLMIGNFFKATCPYLYELDTVAYFAIKRNFHTYSTIAGIRETTQLLLDIYQVNNKTYIHPLKVWQRYSPTMFFPHLLQGQEAVCITASSDASELFTNIHRGENRLDYWNIIFNEARKVLNFSPGQQEEAKKRLMYMLIGSDSRMFELCDRYFTLKDILVIASREVGTGFIGGKSVGMLLARKILEMEGKDVLHHSWNPMIPSISGRMFFTPILYKTAGGDFGQSKRRKTDIISMHPNWARSFYTESFLKIFRNSLFKYWNISDSLPLLYAPALYWKIILEMHLQGNMKVFSV